MLENKWLLRGTYHSPSQSDEYFFNNLDKALEAYIKMIKFCFGGILTQKYRNNA